MIAKISSIVSEFDTEEQANSYDAWFRAEVQASLDDAGQTTPHDEAMAEMDAIILAAEKRRMVV